MHASQTKRLCVREAPSGENTAQNNLESSTEATSQSLVQEHIQSTSSIPPTSQNSNSTDSSIVNNNSQTTSTTISGNSYSLNPVRAVKRPSATGDPFGGVDTANLEPIGSRSKRLASSAVKMTASVADSPNDACNDKQSPNKGNLTSATTTTSSNNGPVIDQSHGLKSAVNDIGTLNNTTKHSISDSEQELVETLANATLEDTKLELILSIRNLITACNKKKSSLVKNPIFSKVLNILDEQDDSSLSVKSQLALLLCSLAKGDETNVKILNDFNVDERILKLILDCKDDSLIEASLRCLRAIMSWPDVSRTWIIYDIYRKKEHDQQLNKTTTTTNDCNPQKIIELAQTSKSHVIQECVSDIFATTCRRPIDQNLLYELGALTCISYLLESTSNKVIVSALGWLCSMCHKNEIISAQALTTTCPNGGSIPCNLTNLMTKDRCNELQFLSAKCFAHIYRALGQDGMAGESRIVSNVLPTLIRMVQQDKPSKLRAEAAECISYLIELEPRLQETASICNHLIESLASMLEQDCPRSFFDSREYYNPVQASTNRCLLERDLALGAIGISHRSQHHHQHYHQPPQQHQTSTYVLDLRSPAQIDYIEASNIISSSSNNGASHSNGSIKHTPVSTESNSNFNGNSKIEYSREMRRAAFLALAALASTKEPIRKKVFETCAVMQHLIKGLTDSERDPKTLKAVLTCLLSLSRSVQQLRTSFAENSIYEALKSLLKTQSQDILILVLAILCNISLDFSPGKQQFLNTTTIDTLCSLTRGSDPWLKLHGMWILMNMVYQLKDQNLKFQILETLGPDHVLSILENEDFEVLVLKTLGFLRNLLSQGPHIEAIMNQHGDSIMQALTRVLQRPCSLRIKEQALCVLTNIADGSASKSRIMKSSSIMSYLARTICDDQSKDMRLAAICCITNLAHQEQDGSRERRVEMRKYGIEDKLKSLLDTSDPKLSDRVRTAYNQFNQLLTKD